MSGALLMTVLTHPLSPLAQQAGKSFWMPEPGSRYAGDVDFVFYLIFWISAVFFVGIVATMVAFVVLYRRREGHREQQTAHGNLPLELTWTIIPFLILVVIFYWGFGTYMEMSAETLNAEEIQVVGRKWSWSFRYPNGWVDNNLHLPVNTDVRLVITSEDVIHSLYIPQFRVKMDAVPGRYHVVNVHPEKPTDPDDPYNLYCAEYCGTQHSQMVAEVIVHRPGGYEKWLQEVSSGWKTEAWHVSGRRFFKRFGCDQCHSVDGSGNIGPTMQDLWGKSEVLQGGERITVDENYIRESILEPNTRLVAGYDAVMPTYKGRISDEEISRIIAYIKHLSGVESVAGDVSPATGGVEAATAAPAAATQTR